MFNIMRIIHTTYTAWVALAIMGAGILNLVIDVPEMRHKGLVKEASVSYWLGIVYLIGAPVLFLIVHILEKIICS